MPKKKQEPATATSPPKHKRSVFKAINNGHMLASHHAGGQPLALTCSPDIEKHLRDHYNDERKMDKNAPLAQVGDPALTSLYAFTIAVDANMPSHYFEFRDRQGKVLSSGRI